MIEARIRALPIWQGDVALSRLGGGITNVNFLAQDTARRAVVRIGDDIPVHQVMRFNELAASRAAHAAGISPAVLHHEPGILVIDFVEGRTLTAADFQDQALVDEALELVKRCHREVPRHLRGPALTFWVFHVIRDYAGTLQAGASRHLPDLPALMEDAARLEAAIGPIELVFGHNDLLPANFLHDGQKMWLIDWDYAGFNSPLFDLGGFAANNALTEGQERAMLARYDGAAPSPARWKSYLAMKAAAALREALWSMVSEIHSELAFDFAQYTADTLATYRKARAVFAAV